MDGTQVVEHLKDTAAMEPRDTDGHQRGKLWLLLLKLWSMPQPESEEGFWVQGHSQGKKVCRRQLVCQLG